MTFRRPLAILLLALALAGPAAALPPSPPPAIARALGQYGPAEAPLTVYEADGKLFADGHGLTASPLLSARGTGFMARRADRPVAVRFEPEAVVLDGERLARHDFGAEVVAAIQAKVKADPAAVRAAALAASPPAESGKKPADLVDLTTVDPRIKLDIRYATSNNFMGFALYERPGAYMQRPAAEALGRAQKALAAQGYGLLIHDAYRPWFVTKMFWEATPPDSRVFVADPAEGSKHNRGCAVDLSMYDLRTGKPVEMTGRYDEMSTRSYADFVGGTSRQRALRQILRSVMEAQGFAVYPQEWWHFDYKDWPVYGIGTATFTELAAR
ncbi:MAG: peptidase vanX D-ala-D-ala dipeptidase [Phenylobacterium sp.]|nr:peptidase vanX D-ala-D-ala dipeptidase [Phenylobacterium sp.]